MNSLDFIFALLACGLVFLAMVVGYSVGHKEGVAQESLRQRKLRKSVGV